MPLMSIIKKETLSLFISLFIICQVIDCANELAYLLNFFQYIIQFQIAGGTHPQKLEQRKKFSQSHPCWVVGALSVLRCDSDVLRNIPTENSCDALSDPKIQAGDSWTLGRVGHLLSSREDSVKEGESLLFCLWGLT